MTHHPYVLSSFARSYVAARRDEAARDRAAALAVRVWAATRRLVQGPRSAERRTAGSPPRA